jgi:hypothetical protein
MDYCGKERLEMTASIITGERDAKNKDQPRSAKRKIPGEQIMRRCYSTVNCSRPLRVKEQTLLKGVILVEQFSRGSRVKGHMLPACERASSIPFLPV